jgi:hypothetical protein
MFAAQHDANSCASLQRRARKGDNVPREDWPPSGTNSDGGRSSSEEMRAMGIRSCSAKTMLQKTETKRQKEKGAQTELKLRRRRLVCSSSCAASLHSTPSRIQAGGSAGGKAAVMAIRHKRWVPHSVGDLHAAAAACHSSSAAPPYCCGWR